MINYFEILNVSEHAETEVIHAAYRGLAKKYHPDTTKLPKEIAEKKMADINEAYRILMDDELRESHLRECNGYQASLKIYMLALICKKSPMRVIIQNLHMNPNQRIMALDFT